MSNLSLTQALPRLINSVPRSRSLEAVLLFWVAGMHAFQLAQIQLSVTDNLDEEILLYWTPLFLASYAVHFVLRFKARARRQSHTPASDASKWSRHLHDLQT